MRTQSRSQARRGRGAITVELAVGSLFLIVMSALAIDISLLMLGYETNDRACRNACRAAAQQETSAEAQQAAQVVLDNVQVDGAFLQQPTLLLGSPHFVYQDYGGDPTAGNPFVTVTSQMLVRTPVPLFFFGSAAFGDADSDGIGDTWTFQKRYTFPIVTFNLVLP